MSYIEEGTEYSADGYKLFTGEFSGTRWEEGKEFYPDGHVKYEGEFNGKNQYDGKGTMYDESGDVSYKGYWKDGDYNVGLKIIKGAVTKCAIILLQLFFMLVYSI